MPGWPTTTGPARVARGDGVTICRIINEPSSRYWIPAASCYGRICMDRTAVAGGRIGGLAAVSRYQWLVFLVVWLGWTLDSADFGLYALVLRPAQIGRASCR